MSSEIANTVELFRKKLYKDKENLNARRKFHEQYEWIETIWYHLYKGKNQIDKFSHDYNSFYWDLPQIREIARLISSYPPVGNSKNNFRPTPSISRATFHLKHHCNLNNDDFPNYKTEVETGQKWNKTNLAALLVIVKQIRDNLFHGRKSELNDPEYTRNKELIKMSLEVTSIILDNFKEAHHQTILA